MILEIIRSDPSYLDDKMRQGKYMRWLLITDLSSLNMLWINRAGLFSVLVVILVHQEILLKIG